MILRRQKMKKISRTLISFLICGAILFGMTTMALADNEVLRLTVAADTHFQCFTDLDDFPADPSQKSNTEGMLDKEVYFYTSTQGQMNYESYAIMKQLLASFITGDDEYLLIAGDLTCGKRQSHIELAQMLREAEKESGKEIFVICGNHDCDDDNFDRYIGIDEFKEIYADFGYNQALNRHSDSGSYTADLSERYRLIAIDSCIYGKDDGEINPSVMEWIREQAQAAKADGKELIGMMHHSILPHFYLQPMIDNYSDLAYVFAELGINMVFTGHIHANDISCAKTASGKKLYDIQTGSLITSPNAFRHVSMGDTVKITSEYITEINTADLMDGYSSEQLGRIEESFSDYSYGFFEAGMCRWVNTFIGSAGKLGKVLKLDSDSPEYQELDRLLRIVGSSVNLPIYDDGSTPGELDSLEEIAASAGYTLPQSDYERVYQVVAALMGNFFHGDSGETSLDGETALLLDCIKAALAHCSVNLIAEGGLNNLLGYLNIELPKDRLVSDAARITCAQGIASELVTSVIEPLLQGISDDYSEPDDINTELDLNNDGSSLVNRASMNVFESIIRYFYRLIKALLNTFAVRY